MASQTAFEFGVERLRLMQFDGSGRKIRVLKVADADMTVPVAGDAEDEAEADDIRLERIEEAVSGFTTDPCSMAYPAGRTIFREFDLPFTNAEQIRKVVRFEAESHLPVDVNNVVVQHHVLREVRDKAHLLVAAVNKDDLLDALDLVGEAGLDPQMVDVDDFALYNALVGTGVVEEHERFVVVNAQERSTSLLFIVGGQLFAVRTIRLGSHGTGEGTDDVGVARTHDYLQRLLREIRRTLTTLPDVGELDAVYAAGNGSRIPEFNQKIGAAFGVDACQPLDLLSRVEHKLSDEEVEHFGPDIGVMLGMAFKLNDVDTTRTDFRREECAYTKKFDQVKTALITLSLLVFLAVAFFGLESYVKLQSAERHYGTLIEIGSNQLRQLVGDNAVADAKWQSADFGLDQMRRIRQGVEDLSDDLRSELGRSEKIPQLTSAMPVWIEFSRLILDNEKELGRFKIEQIDVNASTRDPAIQLTGVLESKTKLQLLIDLLESHAMVTNVDNRGSTPVGDAIRFSDMKISIDLDEALRAAQGALLEETV